MKIKELLLERIKNLFTTKQKDKYGPSVWNLLQKSYTNIGGYRGADSLDELMNKSKMWKLVLRNGQITAVKIYKDQFGRKSIGIATNGTRQGYRDFLMLLKDDIKMERAWSEISGAPERAALQFGAKPISSKFAEFLTGKHIVAYNNDGYHYTRIIGGEPHEKIILGFANLTAENLKLLKSKGLDINEIPANIRIPFDI